MEISNPPVSHNQKSIKATPDDISSVAKGLEMAFLTEILSFIGLEGKGGGFDGGIGEAQFHSFLRENYAKAIVESGGLSLAEHFAESIKER